jgi:hypothetical protein
MTQVDPPRPSAVDPTQVTSVVSPTSTTNTPTPADLSASANVVPSDPAPSSSPVAPKSTDGFNSSPQTDLTSPLKPSDSAPQADVQPVLQPVDAAPAISPAPTPAESAVAAQAALGQGGQSENVVNQPGQPIIAQTPDVADTVAALAGTPAESTVPQPIVDPTAGSAGGNAVAYLPPAGGAVDAHGLAPLGQDPSGATKSITADDTAYNDQLHNTALNQISSGTVSFEGKTVEAYTYARGAGLGLREVGGAELSMNVGAGLPFGHVAVDPQVGQRMRAAAIFTGRPVEGLSTDTYDVYMLSDGVRQAFGIL